MEMSPSCDSASGVKHTQRDLDMCVPVFRGVHPELSCAALCFIWSAAVDTPTPAGSTTSTKHVSRSRASSSPSNWKDFFFLLRSVKLEWGPRLTSTLKPMIGLFFFFLNAVYRFFFHAINTENQIIWTSNSWGSAVRCSVSFFLFFDKVWGRGETCRCYFEVLYWTVEPK